MIRLGVVVVTYNSREVLPGLASSLADGCRGTDWEVAVVDNASTDASAEMARQCVPHAHIVLMGRNAGYAAGINAGVQRLGDKDAYLLLNPDVRLGPGCVSELWRAMTEHAAGIAVPRLVDARGQVILSQRRRPTMTRAWADALVGAERAGRWGTMGEVVATPEAYDRVSFVDWAEGSTQLVSSACWRACGPWDETYFLYSEETEFALRASDLGFATVFVPTAGAQHLEGGSATSPLHWPLVQANRLRLYSRRHSLPAAAAFWAALLTREASRSLLGRKPSRAATKTLLSARALRRPAGPEWVRGGSITSR